MPRGLHEALPLLARVAPHLAAEAQHAHLVPGGVYVELGLPHSLDGDAAQLAAQLARRRVLTAEATAELKGDWEAFET